MAVDVNWQEYFLKIKSQCPWSYRSWQRGLIDIQPWRGAAMDLGIYDARVYIVDMPTKELEQLCYDLDEGEYEWLFSYPGYGSWATPVSCLIQQDRQELARIRASLTKENK